MIGEENICSKVRVEMMDWIGHALKKGPTDDCNVAPGEDGRGSDDWGEKIPGPL